MQTKNFPAERLPLSQKLSYSFANMSLNTLNGIISTGLSFFYVTVLGLDPIIAGRIPPSLIIFFGGWVRKSIDMTPIP